MNNHPHEHLLHTLNALLIEVNALQRTLQAGEEQHTPIEPGIMRGGLKDVEELAREALAMVRAHIEDFSPAELEEASLADALTRLIETTAERLGLTSRISLSGVDEQNRPKEHYLSTQAERLLFLVVREALYQVESHPDARRLRFTLSYSQQDVQIVIEDDGKPRQGADESSANVINAPPFNDINSAARIAYEAQSLVIHELIRRLEHLGGALELVILGERGTRVLVRMPYTTYAHKVEARQSSAKTTARVSNNREESSPAPAEAAEKISILVVDSQAVIRAGLHSLLESYPGLQVIGEAADGVQAVSETLELGPRVVLMDAQLPDGQTLDALRQIKQLNLETKVLLLAAQVREEYLYDTLRAGADGYVLKDIAPDELVLAVRTVARGEVMVQPELAGRLLSRFGRQGRGETRYDTLTARELEVLRLLARGLRNKEIAARLYVSERTVNFHLANIYQKLNVSGRTEALSRALEQGLITP